MIRRLTDDEEQLWRRLRETVRPLRKRKPAEASDRPAPTAPAAKAVPKKPRPVKPAPVVEPPKPPPLAPPALAPFEEKTLRRLARGLVEVDSRIDLHGMRQERAFSVLGSFLRHAQARGDKIVLVVTGKGRASEDGRGVLKQSVPAWLAHDELRPFVVGMEEAGRRHGGSGALYVRIRRRREARDRRSRA